MSRAQSIIVLRRPYKTQKDARSRVTMTSEVISDALLYNAGQAADAAVEVLVGEATLEPLVLID